MNKCWETQRAFPWHKVEKKRKFLKKSSCVYGQRLDLVLYICEHVQPGWARGLCIVSLSWDFLKPMVAERREKRDNSPWLQNTDYHLRTMARNCEILQSIQGNKKCWTCVRINRNYIPAMCSLQIIDLYDVVVKIIQAQPV